MSPGQRKDPKTLPITTSMMAAASSPPALRVMTILDAMVVGRQLVTSIPRRTEMSMTLVRRSPAAMMIHMMAITEKDRRPVSNDDDRWENEGIAKYLAILLV